MSDHVLASTSNHSGLKRNLVARFASNTFRLMCLFSVSSPLNRLLCLISPVTYTLEIFRGENGFGPDALGRSFPVYFTLQQHFLIEIIPGGLILIIQFKKLEIILKYRFYNFLK